jgi:cobalt/nickel transport protein
MKASTKVVAAGILLVALLLAGVVSRFASGDPDGLTKVSEDHGFAATGTTHHGLLGGYSGLTGVLGVLVVLALAGGVTYAVRRRPRDNRSRDTD